MGLLPNIIYRDGKEKEGYLDIATKVLRVYTVSKKEKGGPLMVDMEKLRKVKQCIDSLAEGVNPFTGQPLPEDDIVNDVKCPEACFGYQRFYRSRCKEQRLRKQQKAGVPIEPGRTGKGWLFSSQPIPASELARRMNKAVSIQDYKKISYRQITDWLVEVGMLKIVENSSGSQRRRPTDGGEKLGISVDNRIGQYGPYQVVLYSETAQHFIVDNVGPSWPLRYPKKKVLNGRCHD